MKVVDCILSIIGVLENISGSFNKNTDTDWDNDDYSGPEEGYEDRAAAVSEDANQDQVAIKWEPSFLDLESVRDRKQQLKREGSTYTPGHVSNCRCNDSVFRRVRGIERKIAQAISNGTSCGALEKASA